MKLPKYDKAFADKLKIVFHKADVDGEVADAVIEVLNDLVAVGRAKRISSQGKGYRDRFRIPLDSHTANAYNDAHLVVALNPTRPDRTEWHMTWENNPSRLDKDGRKRLRALARELLGPAAQRLLVNACVQEVHTTIDFPVHISEVAIEVEDKNSAGAWGKRFADHGLLQTLYFGSSSSDHQLCVYDKRAELLAAFASRPDVKLDMVKDKVDKNIKRLRIEDRQRAAPTPVPLHRLADLREPFAGMHIYSYSEAELDLNTTLHKVTLELAKERGLQAALKLLGKSERETFRRALARCRVDWWNASTYAGAVTAVVKATGLFPEEAFDVLSRQSSYAEQLYQERKQRMQTKTQRAAEDLRSYLEVDEDEDA